MDISVSVIDSTLERYGELKALFKLNKCFKLVCGAGNEDIEEVRKLATVYTLAGANMLDLSANVEVVKAAKKGIEKAYGLALVLEREIRMRPYLNVSIGMKGDPHVRKAEINTGICVQCGECIHSCRQEAITTDFTVMQYRCIGCGDCEKVCEVNAISYVHRKADFNKILPECVKEGVETMELHAVTEDEEGVFNDWKLLNSIIKENYLSMCLDRQLLSNKRLIERIERAYEITGDRLIIQADGVPMGGEGDDYGTTLQAIACAEIVQKSGVPAMVLLSGGTNSKTGLLARQCGVSANGVAIGSWARRIVKSYVNSGEFDTDIGIIKKAVSVAEDLINLNMEAISGQTGN
jgi:Fe-S-cluster-containing hydrogenase component 2